MGRGWIAVRWEWRGGFNVFLFEQVGVRRRFCTSLGARQRSDKRGAAPPTFFSSFISLGVHCGYLHCISTIHTYIDIGLRTCIHTICTLRSI